MSSFEILKPARRVVAKVGSALVTNGGAGIDRSAIARWATDVAALRQRGVEVVFVSSGAVAEGMARLGWKERPKAISELQAAAAVGQMGLVNVYEQAFGAHGLRMDLRDGNDLSAAWQRGSTMLDTLGIDDRFKLWFITKQWILDKGLQLQTDDRLRRENPNSWDRMDQQWKDAHPGGWQTPTVPIFDIDWLRSKKKK